MAGRFQDLAPETMSPGQRAAYDKIVAGPRGALFGPFSVLIRAPEVIQPVQELGARLRWGTSLPARLSELAICITGAFWRAQYEWFAHAPLAEEAGVSKAVLEAIRTGKVPEFDKADEKLIHAIITELLDKKRLTDATFAEAMANFGEVGLVELIGIMGHYALIANTLNAFMVPLPEGSPLPFPE